LSLDALTPTRRGSGLTAVVANAGA